MGLIVCFVGGMFFYSISNFGPIYFSRVYDTKPITIGVRSTIFQICDLSGAIILNFLISRFPRYIPMIIGASCALTSKSSPDTFHRIFSLIDIYLLQLLVPDSSSLERQTTLTPWLALLPSLDLGSVGSWQALPQL